jgi:hypothetical protein
MNSKKSSDRLFQNVSYLACLSLFAFAASAAAQTKPLDSVSVSTSKVAVQPDVRSVSKDSVLIQSVSEVSSLSRSSNGFSNVSDRRNLTAQTVTAQPTQSTQTTNVSQLLPQITTLGKEGDGSRASGKMAQVTSVSQLSDVKPTDWAFTALQSLVERYGCIAGYPDRTYRGQRAMTRYEFAAGLNACLDKINEIISAGLADKVSKEDLAAVQKLQEEFAAELATLRGRVDALEAKTDKLEAQQFSTTTKLSGLVFFNVTGAAGGDNVSVETGSRDPVTLLPVVGKATRPNLTFSGLAWLTLKTSFTGKDALTTQLAMGNGSSPYNSYNQNTSFGFFNTTGVPFTDQTAGINSNQVVLRELSYQFPVFDKASLVVGARVNFYKYFDNNRFTFFLDGTTTFNSINSPLLTNAKRGAGVVFMTPLGQNFDFKVGYLAEDNEFLPGPRSAADVNQGLFGGNNALTAEIGFKPSDSFNLRLIYSRTNLQAFAGLVGGSGATPSLVGIADDGAGGALKNGQSDVFVANFDWLVTKGFGLFGRYGISSTNLNKVTGGSAGSVTTQSFQFGLAFPDLFKEGAMGTLSLVMPFNFTGGRNLLVAGAGNGGVQYDIEAAYSFPVTKNISIVPAAYLILNPNNFSGNPSIFVGNMRMQFSF